MLKTVIRSASTARVAPEAVLAAAKKILPAFAGADLGALASHIGVDEATLVAALPPANGRFPFGEGHFVHLLFGLVTTARFTELAGGSKVAARKLAERFNLLEKWKDAERAERAERPRNAREAARSQVRAGKAPDASALTTEDALRAMGDDGSTIDAALEAMTRKGAPDAEPFQQLLEARLTFPGGHDAALRYYRATLARARKDPEEYLFEPPAAIVDDVIADVLPIVLTALPDLRERYNVALVGSTLTTLLAHAGEAGRVTLARLVSALSDGDLVALAEAARHLPALDAERAARVDESLRRALGAASEGRTPRWSKPALALLRRLGLLEGAGPTLPAPTTEEEVFRLLTELVPSWKKAKPARSAPRDLPAPLAAFYARAGSMPPFIDKPAELPALRQVLARLVERADLDTDGVPLAKLSPPETWCVLGRDQAGDYFFLDPAHAGLVLRYELAEQSITAESTSLWAFVFARAIEPWARGEGLDRELVERIVAERKRAAATLGM